jgi:predicted GH43/DUF377 family glycosyl hydrolase
MFKWKKLGKMFDPKDMKTKTWMHDFAQSPSAVIHETFVRVYFCSRPAPGPDGLYLSYISFIDVERANLLNVLRVREEPVLSLGRRGTFDEFGTYPVSVIRDQDEVRAYYSGFTRCESVPFNAAIGLAVSRDGGESFRRMGEGPVISYSPDEPFLMGSPRVRKFNGRWHLWYVAGKEWLNLNGKLEPVYKIRMASSDNGIDWIKLGKDLIVDKLGPQECQACADVNYRHGKYHMFFSYRDIQNYKRREGGYRIGYASSDDMVDWVRNDELAGMSISENGWDSEMVNYPHVFVLDGNTYMLYQGNEMGRAGFGLAVLEESAEWGKDEVV